MNVNYQIPIRYGLIAGFTLCVFSLAAYFFYDFLFGSMMWQMLFGLFTFGIMLFFPIWGAVTYKREKGGNVTFGEIFIAVLIICFISLTLSSILQYMIPNVIDPDYPEAAYNRVVKTTTASMEKFGASDEDIAKGLTRIKLEDFNPTPSKAIQNFGISLLVSVGLSLLIAVFVARKRREEGTTLDEPVT